MYSKDCSVDCRYTLLGTHYFHSFLVGNSHLLEGQGVFYAYAEPPVLSQVRGPVLTLHSALGIRC